MEERIEELSIEELTKLNEIIDYCNGMNSAEAGLYEIVDVQKLNRMNTKLVRKYTQYSKTVYASYDIVIRPNIISVERELLCGDKTNNSNFEICKYKNGIVVIQDGEIVKSYKQDSNGIVKIKSCRK